MTAGEGRVRRRSCKLSARLNRVSVPSPVPIPLRSTRRPLALWGRPKNTSTVAIITWLLSEHAGDLLLLIGGGAAEVKNNIQHEFHPSWLDSTLNYKRKASTNARLRALRPPSSGADQCQARTRQPDKSNDAGFCTGSACMARGAQIKAPGAAKCNLPLSDGVENPIQRT